MPRNRKWRRNRRKIIGTAALAIVIAVAVLWNLLTGGGPQRITVVGVDRTRSASHNATWPTEVAANVRQSLLDAFANGFDRFVVLGIGANVGDTAKAIDVSLDINCPNDRRCKEDIATIADQVAPLAARLAETPTTTAGSDIVAGLVSARALCGDSVCHIVVLSDLQDSRLAAPGDPGALAESLASSMPSFASKEVDLIGIGADGAPSEAVARAETFFIDLLTTAGTSPRISRNL